MAELPGPDAVVILLPRMGPAYNNAKRALHYILAGLQTFLISEFRYFSRSDGVQYAFFSPRHASCTRYLERPERQSSERPDGRRPRRHTGLDVKSATPLRSNEPAVPITETGGKVLRRLSGLPGWVFVIFWVVVIGVSLALLGDPVPVLVLAWRETPRDTRGKCVGPRRLPLGPRPAAGPTRARGPRDSTRPIAPGRRPRRSAHTSRRRSRPRRPTR